MTMNSVDNMKRIATAEWIHTVIDSCKTEEHFDSAWNLIRNFKRISPDESSLVGMLIQYYTEKYNEIIENKGK